MRVEVCGLRRVGCAAGLFALAAAAPLRAEAPQGGGGVLDDVKLAAQRAALPALSGDNPFVLREAWWSGSVDPGRAKLVQVQLFRRNEYRFWLAAASRRAELDLNLYNGEGDLVPTEQIQFEDGNVVGIVVAPEATGVHYLRISLRTTVEEPQDWALIYAYR